MLMTLSGSGRRLETSLGILLWSSGGITHARPQLADMLGGIGTSLPGMAADLIISSVSSASAVV